MIPLCSFSDIFTRMPTSLGPEAIARPGHWSPVVTLPFHRHR